MADDVVRLLDHLQLRRAHLVGYSMGGDIANKVRERHPLRLYTITMGGVGRGVLKGWTTSDFDYRRIAESRERGEGLKVLFREPNGAGRRTLSESEIEEWNNYFMQGQDQFALAAVIRAYPDL
jgi:pimeloyl-ACP methyl ester carboxylesterase